MVYIGLGIKITFGATAGRSILMTDRSESRVRKKWLLHGFKYIIEIFSISFVLFCLVLIDSSVCGSHTGIRPLDYRIPLLKMYMYQRVQ